MNVNKRSVMKGHLGDRFEGITSTPKDMLQMLDCDNDSIRGFVVNGEKYQLSDRFYKGIANELGIPFGVFGFFSPAEVMTRAAERMPDLQMRVTVDVKDKKALGVAAAKSVPMPVKYIEKVLRDDRRLAGLEYQDGVIEAEIDLDQNWSVKNDSEYRIHAICRVPVDGIGKPNINLATWRQVCTNGAIAESSIFNTKLEIKDNSGEHFRRLVASFDNPTGIEMIQERCEEAAETKASVGELLMLEGVIRRAIPSGKNQTLVRERLYALAQNPCVRYGVTDLANIGMKRRMLLPVGCSVADLLNFASELSTHHADIIQDDKGINSFTGTIMSKGCDLADLYPNSQKTMAFYMKDVEFDKSIYAQAS